MKDVDGFITDRTVKEKYISFDTLAPIGIFYCSNVQSGTDVKIYLKELPSFNEVFDCFFSCKNHLFKRNEKQDICLSLFYQPYFAEFYEKVKREANLLSAKHLKFIKKYLLEYLANPYHYQGIVEQVIFGENIRNYYIEKDIYRKSKELLEQI